MDIIAAAALIAVGIVVAAAVYARQGGRSHAVAATAGVAPRTRSLTSPRRSCSGPSNCSNGGFPAKPLTRVRPVAFASGSGHSACWCGRATRVISPPTPCTNGIVSDEIASVECRYYDLVKRTNGPVGRKKNQEITHYFGFGAALRSNFVRSPSSDPPGLQPIS